MASLPARITLALCMVSLIGCTSLRTIAQGEGPAMSSSRLSQQIVRDDQLVITRTDTSVQQLKVVAVLPDAIEGMVGGQLTRVPLDQIRKIDKREIDGMKTTFLVVAIVGGVALIIEAAKGAAAASLLGGG